MQHVMVVSLGPVQDFIAAARKCQDLWFGSHLLSDLSAALAEAVGGNSGNSTGLVVPGDMSGGAVANEIIAIVEDVELAASSAVAALDARLDAWVEWAFEGIPTREEGGYFLKDVAVAQVKDLIELLWAAAPIEAGDYASARDLAKRRLASRKATRTWSRVDLQSGTNVSSTRYEGPWPKSTLDGARASVIHEDAYPPRNVEKFRRVYKAKPAERLSGVDLLKRVGQDMSETSFPAHRPRPVFHSTSHVASFGVRARLGRGGRFGWHERLERDGVDVDRFRLRADGDFDGYLLYEDRLTELYSEYRKGGGEDVAGLVAESRSFLRGVLREAGLVQPPFAYYAVLLADGDRMGRFISEHCRTEEEHRRFSEVLEKWAASCRPLVERHGGSCVYAGGDDVLALVPLHTALRLARELRDTFVDRMGTLVDGVAGADVPTLSVGLAIAHHMQPMRDALELARSAERRAKDAGRDALCVAWKKRSGGSVVSVARKWEERLDERLPEWAARFGDELLPDKVAFAFEEALAAFDRKSPPSPELMTSLLMRTLSRRRAGAGSAPIDEGNERKLADALGLSTAVDGKELLGRVSALSHELQLARLFHDAYAEIRS